MERVSPIDDCDLDTERQPTVLEIIASVDGFRAREIVQELWGSGYTIVARRRGDPFDVPQDLIPRGMSYQWANKADLDHLKKLHWHQVPASRHDGIFAPAGFVGDIEVGGMLLVERLKSEVDEAHAASIAKAHKNVDDWVEKYGGQFSGGVRVWTGDPDKPPTAFRPVGKPETARVVVVQSPALADPKLEPAPVTTVAPAPQPRQSWLRRLLNLISTEH